MQLHTFDLSTNTITFLFFFFAHLIRTYHNTKHKEVGFLNYRFCSMEIRVIAIVVRHECRFLYEFWNAIRLGYCNRTWNQHWFYLLNETHFSNLNSILSTFSFHFTIGARICQNIDLNIEHIVWIDSAFNLICVRQKFNFSSNGVVYHLVPHRINGCLVFCV